MSNILYEDHQKYLHDAPVIYHGDRVTRELPCRINWHENIEIILVRRGQGRVLCDENILPVKEQDTVVINAQVIHTMLTDSVLEYDCFIFNREDLLKNGLDTSTVRLSDFPGRDDELIRRLDRVRESMTGERFLPEINAAMLEVMLYLYRFYRTDEPERAESENDPVHRALMFLNNNWNRPISMDEAAAYAGISKYHFMRRFKAATGKTPLMYLQEKRCRIAAVLLRQHAAPVSEIAAMVGYETPSYFSKVFYAVTGKKPSQL